METTTPGDWSPGVRASDAGTVVALFERTVRHHPDRTAVSDDRGAMTYRELANRSDGLAHELRRRGVLRENRVAVHMSSSVDLFVAVLAILKAGGAYVAVDVRYPEVRRNLMITASGARLVVTTSELAPALAGLGVDVFDLGATRDTVAQDGPPLPDVDGADAACVLFTSGSSGEPKAVVLEHRNLVHFADNRALPRLRPTDRVGQVSSLSFDAFHFETWCAFAAGAEVVVLPGMAELVADDLGRELRRRRITALLAPTMAVNHVVHVDREAFSTLRVLHTGGDVLQPAAARALLSGDFAGEFCNLYGPTEATTACTAHPVANVAADATSVPIGRELDGVSVHLLDADLTEVPAGSVGELHIGGRGVARGYLGRPGLTAERFLPDPFAAGGGRMYATGDLARRIEGGSLDFVGRADDQVKIRGYRVEPHEVERALLRHPDVRDIAVIPTGEGHDRRLVALVVSPQRLAPKQLRAFAVRELPDYLVPSSFVRVAEIPGDDHGKRDLRELRRVAAEQRGRQSRRVAPQDDVERYLADLWEELLAVEWIGVDDDFLGLGGNSMQAFRLHRRIKHDLGAVVQVREILEVRELAGLAKLVRERSVRP
ncbi:hypothetical protein ALI22I_09545 [Saccharothrix sp. ALI-22-I]|nr:hypothetical protein ALI22I_09545 [Saccharothrix sp. ALI-22-I]